MPYDLAVQAAGPTSCEGCVLIATGSRAAEVEHGWCVAADGRAIEVTLRQPGLSYFGIPYRPEQPAGGDLPLVDNIVLERMKEADGTPPAAVE